MLVIGQRPRDVADCSCLCTPKTPVKRVERKRTRTQRDWQYTPAIDIIPRPEFNEIII
ncbi:Uncharacterized protein APZ42_019283 [Daphnia magna]|uniref:Uncharacterized protein n=1 Tax=Daphnia magna TaxID=35525 RepID=A0A162CP26_9CRUS|nr:Uncharacterized protein APZ42_019283 [Daphnia magna]